MAHKKLLKWIHRTTELCTIRKADAIIAISRYTQAFAQKITKKPVSLLEISFDKITRNSSPVSKKLLFVGRVEYIKGIDALIDALVLLKKENIDIALDVVGDYSEDKCYKSLKEKIYKNNLNVIFHGRVESLDKFYESAYVFVFPSRLEGYGIVLLEAMSYSLPVIAFNNTAIPYTITHNENGLLVETNDIVSLKNAIRDIIEDDELRKKLSIGALNYYNNIRSYEDWNKDIDEFSEQIV